MVTRDVCCIAHKVKSMISLKAWMSVVMRLPGKTWGSSGSSLKSMTREAKWRKVNVCALPTPPHRTLPSGFSSEKRSSFSIKTNTQSWIPKWLRRLLLHCRLLSCPPGACSSAVRSLDPATKPTPCAPCIRALFIKISDIQTRTTFAQRCVREQNQDRRRIYAENTPRD